MANRIDHRLPEDAVTASGTDVHTPAVRLESDYRIKTTARALADSLELDDSGDQSAHAASIGRHIANDSARLDCNKN